MAAQLALRSREAAMRLEHPQSQLPPLVHAVPAWLIANSVVCPEQAQVPAATRIDGWGGHVCGFSCVGLGTVIDCCCAVSASPRAVMDCGGGGCEIVSGCGSVSGCAASCLGCTCGVGMDL